MDDFEDFEKALIEEGKQKKGKEDGGVNLCLHKQTFYDHTQKIHVCGVCFHKIDGITKNSEWRYYGEPDSRGANPSRCHIRKVSDKNIFKDVQGLDIPYPVMFEANQIYNEVTEGKTCRATNRQAIIFACVFHAYKIKGSPQSFDKLQKVFKLDPKNISRGMKKVGLKISEYIKRQKQLPSYVTPINLIPEIMSKFNAGDEHIQNVQKLYERIENRSSVLNRSKPQSVASSLIYYYIVETNRQINIEEFTEKVGLSELTINKINKEIKHILSQSS